MWQNQIHSYCLPCNKTLTLNIEGIWKVKIQNLLLWSCTLNSMYSDIFKESEDDDKDSGVLLSTTTLCCQEYPANVFIDILFHVSPWIQNEFGNIILQGNWICNFLQLLLFPEFATSCLSIQESCHLLSHW